MINKWLEKFESSWRAKDVATVLELFTDEVEYWETPFKKVNSKSELTEEWSAIQSQENLVVTTTVFNSEGNKHSVIWGITYDKDGVQQVWSGVYLIELNNEGLCKYFQQIGEKK